MFEMSVALPSSQTNVSLVAYLIYTNSCRYTSKNKFPCNIIRIQHTIHYPCFDLTAGPGPVNFKQGQYMLQVAGPMDQSILYRQSMQTQNKLDILLDLSSAILNHMHFFWLIASIVVILVLEYQTITICFTWWSNWIPLYKRFRHICPESQTPDLTSSFIQHKSVQYDKSVQYGPYKF